jgi:hypothetical protein
MAKLIHLPDQGFNSFNFFTFVMQKYSVEKNPYIFHPADISRQYNWVLPIA